MRSPAQIKAVFSGWASAVCSNNSCKSPGRKSSGDGSCPQIALWLLLVNRRQTNDPEIAHNFNKTGRAC
jgi:hypothetical protein